MAPFYHDSTGVSDEIGGRRTLPDKQWFAFQIIDAEEEKSKNGNDMIKCVCKVIDSLEYAGTKVWHYVVFLPKGSKGDSLNVHFRKCIGQPYGKNDLIDAKNWLQCRFYGYVVADEYNGKKNSKISQVKPYDEAPADDSKVPF